VQFCRGEGRRAAGPVTLAAPAPVMAGGRPISLGLRLKICVADWNGDGHQDLLAGNFGVDRTARGSARPYLGNVYVMLRQPPIPAASGGR